MKTGDLVVLKEGVRRVTLEDYEINESIIDGLMDGKAYKVLDESPDSCRLGNSGWTRREWLELYDDVLGVAEDL